ncbi:unnamed protein product [Urochloa humidicola]
MKKMDRSWMYNISRWDPYFHQELEKFLKVTKNHAMDESTKDICRPCKVCKNHGVFNNLVTIRSHVMVNSFVKDQTLWTYHGEMKDTDVVNQLQDIWRDPEAVNKYFDGYDEDYGFEDNGSDDSVDDGSGGDGVDGGEDIAGDEGAEDIVRDEGGDGSGGDEFDDSNFLGQLLRYTKAELLVGSAKGAQNVEVLKKQLKKPMLA